MRVQSKKINDNLSVNKVVVEKISPDSVVECGKNIIFAIDVSGSMYDELPKIRQQLKNRIPDLVGINDTLSIIWFSGKSQSGVLKEGVKVKNLMDIKMLNDAIDRFLVPIGLTAFLPPLELTESVISNLKSNGNAFSFIFLSDGYNNDSSWSEVIKAVEGLESKVDSSTFIEYGYYADSDSLTEMSELMGGEKIFSKDFDSYSIDLEKIIQKKSSPRRSIDISPFKSEMMYQFVYTIDKTNESVNVFSTKGKYEVLVPEDVDTLYFISKKPVSSEVAEINESELLSSAYILSDRLRYSNVEDILIYIGDLSLINKFTGAFGKQKLNELKDELKELSFNTTNLYSLGKIPAGYSINPNQYCVIDLISDLQKGDCYFYPYSKLFNYNRVSGKKVTKVEIDESVKAAMSEAKSLTEINKIISEISAPEFVYPDNASEIPMSFNTLVWNQDRANLSVQTKLNGKVKLPKNDFGLTEVDSFIYRNYTLIKDGIVNVSHIPVSLDDKTFNKLSSMGLLSDINGTILLNISSIPTVNRSMTIRPSAKKLAGLEFDLVRLQAHQKYLKHLKSELQEADGILNKSNYPDDVYEWLKSVGITDNGGFSPKVESVESTDFYVSPVLKVKIEKTSTIPKISDFIAKVNSGKKLNIVESILKNRHEEFNDKYNSYNIDDIELEIKQVDKLRREYLVEIAKIKFGVILSRSWFKEFATLSENELSIKFDEVDTELKVVFDYKDEQVKI